MSKKRKSVLVQSFPGQILIHEVEDKTIRHRIIIVEGGTADVGKWAEAHELAQHKGYVANMQSGSVLPLGVFKVRACPTQSVGY